MEQINDIELRNEAEADYRKTENAVREAFWNLNVPGCDEHYLTHVMRNHPDFIPDMDFVAVAGSEILGCIMFTKSRLRNAAGKEIETATFGPVCVLPEYQGQGIGSALIRKGIERAREKGFPAIVIYGDPRNYCKHGFLNGRDCGISDSEGRFSYALLALILNPAKLSGQVWHFHGSEVFGIDAEEARKFDAGFPPKGKKATPDQIVFAMQCRAYLEP
ncbi:MAG: N-acetyltransferase [Treponemataceae bacterium]